MPRARTGRRFPPRLASRGIDAAQRLRAQGCDAKLIFLTMHGDALFVQGAMRAGAAAYILKRDAPDTLVDAIRRVAQGLGGSGSGAV